MCIRDRPYTTAFGILFLPFEGLYAEVVNAGLLEVLQRDYQVNIAAVSYTHLISSTAKMIFICSACATSSRGRCWSASSGRAGLFMSAMCTRTHPTLLADVYKRQSLWKIRMPTRL